MFAYFIDVFRYQVYDSTVKRLKKNNLNKRRFGTPLIPLNSKKKNELVSPPPDILLFSNKEHPIRYSGKGLDGKPEGPYYELDEKKIMAMAKAFKRTCPAILYDYLQDTRGDFRGEKFGIMWCLKGKQSTSPSKRVGDEG
jgi:hypothetical protein